MVWCQLLGKLSYLVLTPSSPRFVLLSYFLSFLFFNFRVASSFGFVFVLCCILIVPFCQSMGFVGFTMLQVFKKII